MEDRDRRLRHDGRRRWLEATPAQGGVERRRPRRDLDQLSFAQFRGRGDDAGALDELRAAIEMRPVQ
ncbi:MAG TPA: hypothetical protein VGD53_13425 [Actinoallomurus sp.]